MNVFKWEFERLLKPMIIWAIVCIGCIILFMSFYPSMSNVGMENLIKTELDALPEAMKEAFNLHKSVDFSKLSDYSLYIIQYIAMAVGVYGAILGVSSLVKEESEGTIEFLYSKPIKREKIVSVKLMASSMIFLLFIILLCISNIIVSVVIRPENMKVVQVLKEVTILYIGMLFLGYIFMAIGFLISVFIKSAKQAVPMALSVFFITYILGILGKLKEQLKILLYFSPFNYGLPDEILTSGLDLKYCIVGIAIIIISIVFTFVIYRKKDFS